MNFAPLFVWILVFLLGKTSAIHIELLFWNAPGKCSWTGLSLVWFAGVTSDSKCHQCHGVFQEKQRFGTIFLSAPNPPPPFPQKKTILFLLSSLRFTTPYCAMPYRVEQWHYVLHASHPYCAIPHPRRPYRTPFLPCIKGCDQWCHLKTPERQNN